jgi:hypothetical protein
MMKLRRNALMMNARWSFLAVPLLAALGCSDPVPLPAQGAISMSIRKSAATCPDSGTTYSVGAPNSPSTSNPGDSLVDGSNGAHISCSVKGSGGGFAFSGTLQASTTVPVYPITVTFSNGVVDATGKGTAAVSVYTPTLSTFYASTDPCTIQVLGNPLQVKGGSIWASFSCPAITASLQGECAVGPSVIVLENCDGS